MLNLLRNKEFRRLFLGQLSSQFGDRLTQLVLVALVATHAGGSSLTLAKVLTATSLPALLVSPLAGAYVDRWDRKRTMMGCDFIRVGVILALPGLAALEGALPLYLGVFLLFAVSSFFVPARLAMIPDLVESGDLSKANALFTTSGMIGSTVILLAGALMVEWMGAARSCWVNAASYLASAVFIAPIVGRGRRPTQRQPGSARLIFQEVAEGIRELLRQPSTRRVIGLVGLLMGGAGMGIVVATVLVQTFLGSVTRDLGFLSLWMGVGMLGGTLLYARWGTQVAKPRVMGWAFLGCGGGLFVFLHAVVNVRSGVAASAAMAGLGVCISPVGIIANTLVHGGHPERLHGRIFSALGVVVNVAFIGSMLLGGWLADRWDGGTVLAGVGILFATAGIALLYYQERRRLFDGQRHRDRHAVQL